MRFSVVVIGLNECDLIRACLESVLIAAGNRAIQLSYVDGGSTDTSTEIAASLGAQVIVSDAGRGVQCNKGLEHSSGDVLIFLHADSQLPADAFSEIETCFAHGIEVGTFRLKFKSNNRWLTFFALFSRFDSLVTTFGDQGIVIRKDLLVEMGGFKNWGLLEDVDLLRKVRRVTRIVKFKQSVITSARRFVKNGVLRQQWKNGFILLRYLLGFNVRDLAAHYEKSKEVSIDA